MEIPELLVRRARLNGELQAAIAPLLSQFRTDTGISIRSVDVQMADVTTYDSKAPEYILGVVATTLALD